MKKLMMTVCAGVAVATACAMPVYESKSVPVRLQAAYAGLGAAAGSLFEAIARQPEAASMIRDGAAKTFESIRRLPVAGLDLGQVGGSLAEAMARQPEASGLLLKARPLVENAVRRIDYRAKDWVEMTETAFIVGMCGFSENGEEGVIVSSLKANDDETDLAQSGVCRTGKALMEAIGRQPEAYGLLCASLSNVVAHMEGRPDAEIGALDVLGGGLVEAVGRQPEAASDLNAAVTTVANAVEGLEEFPALTLGRISKSMVEAMGRQPEVASNLVEMFSALAPTVVGRPNSACFAIGKTGMSLLEAAGRQPEDMPELLAAAMGVVDELDGRPDDEVIAIGLMGGKLMEAMGRQPEAASNLCEAAMFAVDLMADRPDAETVALGQVGGSLVEAVGRQPEVASNLCEAAKLVADLMADRPDAEAVALGKSGGALVEAMARQPEAASNLCEAVKLVADLMADRPDAEAVALGKAGGALIESIARQPEAESNLYEAVTLVADLMFDRSAGVVCGLGKVGKALMESIARQPEASEDLIATLKTVARCMGDRDAEKARAVGVVGASLIEAIARQPEATGQLRKSFLIAAAGILSCPTEAALGLGKAGGMLMEAIGRQPEASGILNSTFAWLLAETAVFELSLDEGAVCGLICPQGAGKPFAAPKKATTYLGSLVDREKGLVGTVTLKLTKPNRDGRMSATMSVSRLDGTPMIVRKAGDISVPDEGPLTIAFDRLNVVTVSGDAIFGRADGFVVDGARDGAATKGDPRADTLQSVVGCWNGILRNWAGDTISFSANVKNGGTASVTCWLPDGTALKSTAKAEVGDGVVVVPVACRKKIRGVEKTLAFRLAFNTVRGTVSVGDRMSFGGTAYRLLSGGRPALKKADVKASEAVLRMSPDGRPFAVLSAGKLRYNEKTGIISGTLKLPLTGSTKQVSLKVCGVAIGAAGVGTAGGYVFELR